MAIKTGSIRYEGEKVIYEKDGLKVVFDTKNKTVSAQVKGPDRKKIGGQVFNYHIDD
jgi:hypothetical protein